jgi:putative membrane protein
MMSPWDVAALGLLLITGTLYFAGSLRLARRGGVHRSFERVAFAGGWLALVATVLPPLDTLSVQLFSIHMVQHELMMLVGAPLMIAGRPLPILLGGLPVRARQAAASLLQAAPAAATWRLLTAPVAAWALHGLAIWIWHLPALYQLAVREEGVHALQHAMFVGTAALFWWGVLYGRYGRAGYGAAVFYVFTTVVHTGVLGAAVTFASMPFYPDYTATSMAHGVDPLQDQQIAGLIMWVPGGFIMTLLGIGLFAAWLGEAQRRERRVSTHARSTVDTTYV